MTNIQVSTQIYFIRNSIPLINDHLTFQDEELALNLISIIDKFKNIENEYSGLNLDQKKQADISEISEAAFAVDDKIAYNLSGNINQAKKKALQRQEMIKLQREKRMNVRE